VQIAGRNGIVDNAPGLLGVPGETIPVVRDERVRADSARELDRLAHVHVADDVSGIAEEVAAVDR
jgi:hypothetical protein